MTPDDVVNRALALDGEEVDLTIRGTVQVLTRADGKTDVSLVRNSLTRNVTIADPIAHAEPDLVDIQPAPMRIVVGELYEVAGIGLCRGQADGGLWAMDAAKAITAGTAEQFTGVKRVKVVDA